MVQPTPKQPPKPQFVPIKPKIPTSSPSMPCKTEAISVDTEPKVHKVPSTSDNCSISTTSVTVSGQTPCIQPTDGKSGGKKPCGQSEHTYFLKLQIKLLMVIWVTSYSFYFLIVIVEGWIIKLEFALKIITWMITLLLHNVESHLIIIFCIVVHRSECLSAEDVERCSTSCSQHD